MDKDDELWIGAYLGALALITLGATIKHDADNPGDVDAMDESARKIADRVMKTIKERGELAGKRARGAS